MGNGKMKLVLRSPGNILFYKKRQQWGESLDWKFKRVKVMISYLKLSYLSKDLTQRKLLTFKEETVLWKYRECSILLSKKQSCFVVDN